MPEDQPPTRYNYEDVSEDEGIESDVGSDAEISLDDVADVENPQDKVTPGLQSKGVVRFFANLTKFSVQLYCRTITINSMNNLGEIFMFKKSSKKHISTK